MNGLCNPPPVETLRRQQRTNSSSRSRAVIASNHGQVSRFDPFYSWSDSPRPRNRIRC